WATIEPNCEVRNSSTATPQSLMLLNGDFVVAQAEAFAIRVRAEAGTDSKAQVVRAWRLAYGCEPTEKDVAAAVAFLKDTTEASRKTPLSAPATGPKGGSASKGGAKKQDETKPGEVPTPESRALATFCQALLSSNRFLYVE